MQVRWLRGAADSLDNVHKYLARESPTAADRMVARIVEAVTALGEHPHLGRPGRVLGTRELVNSGTSYVAPYRVRAGRVEVLRVHHGAQRLPDYL